MPRKIVPAAPAVPPPAMTPPQSMPIEETPSIMEELHGVQDATIHVYAEPEKGQGGAAYLFRVQAADYGDLAELMDYIKTHPDGGPGCYSLRPRVGGQWKGAHRIRIAGTRAPVPVAPVAAAAPAAPPPNDQFLSFLQTMVITLLGKDRPAPTGPGFGEVIEAAKLLAPPKERTSITELKELLSLRDLLKPADADRDTGGGRDWLTAAIETFGPPIAAAVTAPPAAPPPAAPAPRAIAPPPTAGPATPPPTQAAPAPAAAVQPNQVAQLVGLLLAGARADGDPEAWASVALDLLGDYAPMIVNRPDALTLIMASNPAAAPHREWFDALLTAAREMLDGGDDGEGLTGVETPADGSGHVDGAPAVVS